MIKGKLLACTIGITVLASLSTVYASSLGEKKTQEKQLQSQMSSVEQQIQNDKHKETLYQSQIDSFTASLNAIGNSLSQNQQQYSLMLKKVDELESKIAHNEISLKAAEDQLANDLRFTYENNNTAYVAVLFQSRSFSDFVSRFTEMSMIAQSQRKTMGEFQDLKQELSSQHSELMKSKKTLEVRRKQLEQLRFINRSLRDKKATALHRVAVQERSDRNKKYTLESQLHETQAQIQQIIDETKAAEQRVQNPTYIQQTQSKFMNVPANDLISYAEQFVGLPYVWGGTTPNPGFDCSGYTQYVFAHFGVMLPRTSEEQFAQGVSVSQSDLQPGDLVFFSTYAPGATHVGIYIGNGMMINSEDAGLIVTSMSIPYWSSRYIGARRVMNHV